MRQVWVRETNHKTFAITTDGENTLYEHQDYHALYETHALVVKFVEAMNQIEALLAETLTIELKDEV